MNPQDPLAALQPLREPDLVGWWPLAPGWWLLLCLVLVAVAVLAYRLRQRHRANAYRREGLRQLQVLEQRFTTEDDPAAFLQALNALLKSVALAAYPAAQVASRHGEDWRSFLNSSMGNGPGFDQALATELYRSCPAPQDRQQLCATARRWIQSHRVPT